MQDVKDWNVNKSWTLFLDRDGVINKRNFDGYITKPEEFKFLEGVPEALNKLKEQFNKIIVVTNQQGISKGIMSKRNLDDVHRYMLDKLSEYGVKFDAIFVATNLRGADNDRRKPNKSMALEAKEMFPEIDFFKSVMIGDTDSDIEFGINLGMKTVLLNSLEKTKLEADLKVNSLKEFALQISKN
ncbi:MAG: HAD-IIIA family hydrolase [Brumimicrobium sp.]